MGHKADACPDMPELVRDKYEEQLKMWLPEHPFLREGSLPANKVFESYLFAIAMREYRSPISRCVEQRLAAREYKPSRLLAEFYIFLGEERGEETVAERQIGLLYDSLLAGETDSLRVRLSIEAGDPDDSDDQEAPGEGEFELIYLASDAGQHEQIECRSFKIIEDNGAICFGRQLKAASIVSRGTVVLGRDTEDFEVGPSVDIRCRRLNIRCTGLVIRSAPSTSFGAGVVLEAATCNSNIARKPIVRGSLSVCWPGAESYPWSDYAVESKADDVGGEQMHEVQRRFRRIVTSLRSHGKGSLARLKDKVEHRRVVKNEMGRALLNRLLDDGILTLKGKFYHWVPSVADDMLKVSWDDLRHRRSTPELQRYLKRFIEDHQGLF